MTELKSQLDALQRAVTEDPLTGLASRLTFDRSLNDACVDLLQGSHFALMLGDLDGFKAVNDTLGHQAGDMLLCEISLRLKGSVGPDVTVARLGGDEFGILLKGIDDEDVVRSVADNLVACVAEPVLIGEQLVRVGISLGVVFAPAMATTASELVRLADEAMYESKRSRKRLAIPLAA